MGWTKPLRLGHPKRASGGAISASSCRFASKNRRIWFGTVCGRIWSTRPMRLERAERLVVQSDAAGIVDEVVALVDHQRADALLAKDIGQGEAHRAGPDDDDVH